MFSFVARRVLATVPVLLIVAVLVFLLLRLTPGDPAAIMAGDAANTEQIARIRSHLGLDQPILTDRKSTRLNSSHIQKSRMPSSA